MEVKFLKSPELLEEDYRVDDLLDFSGVVEDFKKDLNKITGSAVVALVGKFGSGKSTMLYQLYKDKGDDKQEKWITFDAWKYPERKDLWEGFVLDFAKEIHPKTFEKVVRKVDGERGRVVKTFKALWGLIGLINGIGKFLGFLNLDSFFETSPARRVFEVQRLLEKNVINQVSQDTIFVIVEDIDRSGDMGTFFLETLHNFIKNSNIGKKFIVIVPVGDRVFEDAKEAYEKCFDYWFPFKPQNIEFTKFIKSVFDDYVLQNKNSIGQINTLLKELLAQNQNPVTIRDVKRILRTANIEYQILLEKSLLDPKVFLTFYAMRYVGGSNRAWRIMGGQKVIDNTDFGYKTLIWIANPDADEGKPISNYLGAGLQITLVPDDSINIPRFVQWGQLASHSYYVLSDKYSNYLGV